MTWVIHRVYASLFDHLPGSSIESSMIILGLCLVPFPKSWNDDIKLLTLNYQNQNVQTVIAQYHLACSQILEAHDSPIPPQRTRAKWKVKDSNTCSAGTKVNGIQIPPRFENQPGQPSQPGPYWGDVSTISSRMVFFWLVGCYANTGKEMGTTDAHHQGRRSFFALYGILKKIQSHRKLAYVDIWLAMIIYADVIHTCVMCMWLCI